MDDLKTCCGCGEEQPVSEFYRNSRSADGLAYRCRSCLRLRKAAYREANLTKIAAYARAYYAANRESVCEKMRAYQKAHPEKVAEQRERARQAHPERKRARKAISLAIAKSQVVRPTTCSKCGCEPDPRHDGRSSIEAHHPDYEKRLEVVWLCRLCHRRLHRGVNDG